MTGAAAQEQPRPCGSGIAEVEIRRWFIGTPPAWLRERDQLDEEQLLSEHDVIAQIDACRARRVRVLLVSLESNGGDIGAARRIYNALRNFARSGRTVVVHVTGWCASSAPLIAMGGQYVLLAPGARFGVHSAIGPAANAARANRFMLDLLTARTFTPRQELEQWLSFHENDAGKPDRVILTGDVAVHRGWADQVATRVEALAFAEALAGGLPALAAEDAAQLDEIGEDLAGAVAYLPQGGDGYRPTVEPALTVFQALPGQVQAGASPDSSSTRGGAIDNIWPNPSSEVNPPSGVDTGAPEWFGRVNLGAGAYAGDWVRSPGVGAFLAVNLEIPALPGEQYYLEAQVKAAVAGANKGGLLQIFAFDKSHSIVGSVTSVANDTTTFGLLSLTLTMPATTVTVRFVLTNGSGVGAQAYFDSIYARRVVDAQTILSLGNRKWSGSWLDDSYVSWGQLSIASGGALSWVGFDEMATPTFSRVVIGGSFGIRMQFSNPSDASVYQTAFSQACFASVASHPEYFSLTLAPAGLVSVPGWFAVDMVISDPVAGGIVDPNTIGTGGLSFQLLILRKNNTL